jgi:CRP/FNR family transcriptional regulator
LAQLTFDLDQKRYIINVSLTGNWALHSAQGEKVNVMTGQAQAVQLSPSIQSPSIQSPSVQCVKVACSNCSLAELCLPLGLPDDKVTMLDRLIDHRPVLKRGAYLYRAGSPFTSLYAIRRGFLKTLVLVEDGREQITGFHMPGDILGIDAISSDSYGSFAVALEDSEVCEIPFARLEDLVRQMPSLQRHVHRIMSREVVHDQGMMVLLGKMRAEERLAVFLLNLSLRYRARGYAADSFHLPMTREEIGNFMGMKLETVSRTFSRLQQMGLIAITNRLIEIKNRQGLIALTDESHPNHLL